MWCIPFELSLYDGAQHWYWQLPRKTKRTWTLLSQAFIKYYCAEFTRSSKVRYYSGKRYSKEHVCDCLNRLNGYAHKAGVQFEDAGRDAKHHVEHFLDTCDDRGLEECLCHVRVSDIYELEGIVDGILRYRGRNSAREPSLCRYRGQDDDRRREGRSTEGPRSGYDRERGFRDIERRHDRPRITPLVESLTDVLSALSAKSSDGSRRGSLAVRRHGYDTTDGCDNVGHPYECSRYSDEKSDGGYGSDPTHGRIEAATESEHRVATNGTLDVIRRMELMTPARISRGLFDGTARLLNGAMVALSKFQGNSDDEPHGIQAVGGPTEKLYFPGREWREFRLPRRQPPRSTHEMWIRRSEKLVPTITKFRRGRPTWVRLTNVSPKGTRCSTHVPVVLWMLNGKLPHDPGYTRLHSDKYRDWQVLADANSRNETFFGREQQRNERYLAEQPSAVDRRDYPTPRKILTRATEALRPAGGCRIISVWQA
ncbi:hypothetical protein PF003_g17277 [Phytophthora fragariae]|nr:hypothetical protein PF003_g17277 [Phytophthora fragariae]